MFQLSSVSVDIMILMSSSCSKASIFCYFGCCYRVMRIFFSFVFWDVTCSVLSFIDLVLKICLKHFCSLLKRET